MKEFDEVNNNLEDTLKTHLINNLNEFGVWNDDYQTFIKKRAEVFSEELKQRIIPQEIDIITENDIEEDKLEEFI
jgi:hypothetical protein